jgi:PAS domain S-box-containing protein
VAAALRKTGIDFVGAVPWSTHFCQFFETPADLLDLLVPYFKAGLEERELCVWLVSEPVTVDGARNALRRAVPDVERYEKAGGLEIHPGQDWVMSGVTLARMTRIWDEKIAQARERGLAGVRLGAWPSWLASDEWSDKCEKFEQLMAGKPIVVLCVYPLATVGAAEILDIARAHRFVVAKRKDRWEVVETAEEALRRSEARLRDVIDTIPVLAGVSLPDGTVEFVNRRWRDYTGLALADAHGSGWKATLHPDDVPAFEDNGRVAAATGATFVGEVRMRRADGAYRWFLVLSAPLRDETGNVLKWYAVATDIEDRRHAEQALRQSELHLKALSRRLLTTQEQERRRVAHELHDQLGQLLTSVKIRLESLKRARGARRAQARLEEAIGTVDVAMQRVRDLALELRPSVLDDLGLPSALRWYADRFARDAHIEAHLSIDAIPRLEPALETACFRVAQEALTNVVRHARARQAWLDLQLLNGGLELRVRDDGIGFDVAAARERASAGASLGLLGMQERVGLAGGTLDISSTPGGGSELRARFPVDADVRGSA